METIEKTSHIDLLDYGDEENSITQVEDDEDSDSVPARISLDGYFENIFFAIRRILHLYVAVFHFLLDR